MADGTHIEWCDATWNPVTGCSVVSPGCTNCYAMRLAGGRLRHHPSRAGLTAASKAGPVWNGRVRFNEEWLDLPLRWKRPRRIFVCAHGDLFHEAVPDAWIDQVVAVMALCPQHVFVVLTKRAQRMMKYCCSLCQLARGFDIVDWERRIVGGDAAYFRRQKRTDGEATGFSWPRPNVWLGVSAEDQRHADARIPELLATPAAVRFASLEPLLGPIDLGPWLEDAVPTREQIDGPLGFHYLRHGAPQIDWVIVGGESGPGARPMHPDWARSLRDQCQAAGVPLFFKQWGEWSDADAVARIVLPDSRWYNPPNNLGCTFGEAALVAKLAGDKPYQHHSDGSTLIRVGKRADGRLLDGREWNECPR